MLPEGISNARIHEQLRGRPSGGRASLVAEAGRDRGLVRVVREWAPPFSFLPCAALFFRFLFVSIWAPS